jgi:hypothetical protein
MVLANRAEVRMDLELSREVLAGFGVIETPKDGIEQLGGLQRNLLAVVTDKRLSHSLLGMAESERINSLRGLEDRAIYEGAEVNSDYLSYSNTFREMARSSEQEIEKKIDELIELPYVQSGEFFGKLDGHPVEYYKNDKDGKFLHGIHYLLLTHPEKIEIAEAFTEYAVKGLVKRGRYDILGSKDFQKTLDTFIAGYGEGKERKKLRLSSVMWFINRSYRRIANHADESVLDSENISSIDDEINGRYGGTISTNTYRQVMKIFTSLNNYKTSKKLADLDKIHDSKVITGKKGLLRLRKQDFASNSDDQQGRMLLLALDNVGQDTAELILRYVQDYPATSRSITGKVPAALHSFLDRHDRPDLLDKSTYNWPTPPVASFPDPLTTLKNMRNIYQYASRAIENGWGIPEEVAILPQASQDKLKVLDQKNHLHWNAPERRLSNKMVVEDKPWEDFYKPLVSQGLLGWLKPGKL